MRPTNSDSTFITIVRHRTARRTRNSEGYPLSFIAIVQALVVVFHKAQALIPPSS